MKRTDVAARSGRRTTEADRRFMSTALKLARKGTGRTSPNPAVGAVLVRQGRILGQGWHHRAGLPHAEVEALKDAQRRGHQPKGATLYVTLEPCSTHGRTPPCTDAIIDAGISRVVAGGTDPNPIHAGKGFNVLRRAGIAVQTGMLEAECGALNEAFNHWIIRRVPFVTVKAAMTLDGKIATASGESKWITGPRARAAGMRLRLTADAILVGINTVLADDPSLTVRTASTGMPAHKAGRWRRIILDSTARLPLRARVATDTFAASTVVVVTKAAPRQRVEALERRVTVWRAPAKDGRVDLCWLLKRLGREGVTHLLVEGGGEVNAAFLLQGLAQRIAFFYAPKILGGRDARKAVAGEGATSLARARKLRDLQWRRLGPDLLLTARVD